MWGPGKKHSFERSYFAIRCVAAAVRSRPDLIVSTHVNFGPVAHTAKRLVGSPFALVAHGIDISDDLPPSVVSSLRAAKRVVCVSHWTRRRVLALSGMRDDRLAILPNTFDEHRFTVGPKPAHLVQRYQIAPTERVILTVARLAAIERYKGYDRVIEALPALRDSHGAVRFLVVGTGDDRDRAQNLARTLGVGDSVTFTGFVPDDELPDHYRLADVFAMPSTGEGFGIVFLESMGCGTPVLAGNQDGSVDALDNGRLGKLVDPGNIHQIASGIASLFDKEGPPLWYDRDALSAATAERFGRAAFREKIESSFSL